MDWIIPAAVIVGLLAVSTALGLIWRARQGAPAVVTPGSSAPRRENDTVDLDELGAGGAPHAPHQGTRATLVQFSTAYCSSCPATRRVLSGISEGSADVAYLDVDVTERGDLIRRFRILQTPTVLVLDRHGEVRTRFGGAVRPAAVRTALEGIR
ncbi:thioredoxin family protein [Herbiconiux moechotypicola]|uniref:Thioredoxin family protein n=1 Tax=Herbiconiux moechotypicola TaxID=637393 RepID=A0ABP5Q0X1_9MICO|nr:thioredoxin family protein [Herbiconiux moechotypicola]MCS5728496.1 thioredoxin family protein [Herbiconiux moechotypicola]